MFLTRSGGGLHTNYYSLIRGSNHAVCSAYLSVLFKELQQGLRLPLETLFVPSSGIKYARRPQLYEIVSWPHPAYVIACGWGDSFIPCDLSTLNFMKFLLYIYYTEIANILDDGQCMVSLGRKLPLEFTCGDFKPCNTLNKKDRYALAVLVSTTPHNLYLWYLSLKVRHSNAL